MRRFVALGEVAALRSVSLITYYQNLRSVVWWLIRMIIVFCAHVLDLLIVWLFWATMKLFGLQALHWKLSMLKRNLWDALLQRPTARRPLKVKHWVTTTNIELEVDLDWLIHYILIILVDRVRSLRLVTRNEVAHDSWALVFEKRAFCLHQGLTGLLRAWICMRKADMLVAWQELVAHMRRGVAEVAAVFLHLLSHLVN